MTVLSDVTMTIHGDREKFTPFGMAGGLNGGGCNLIINKGTDREFNAGMYATGVELKKGDTIFYASSGGGGFGNPLDRDPRLVLGDVMDEWLTVETARKFYGVAVDVVDPEALDYRIDESETAKLRAELTQAIFVEGLGAHQLNPRTRDIKLAWMPTEEEVQSHITVSRPPGW
jgi:N-methylhydantoinase B